MITSEMLGTRLHSSSMIFDVPTVHTKRLDEKEPRAVVRIETNPKSFFSYAKSLSKIKSSINMLLDSNKPRALKINLKGPV